MLKDFPFTPGGVAVALEHEAVFGARNPQLLLKSDRHLVCFRDGEFRTADPEQIDFLQRVVADEARGNRGVWVKFLPAPATALTHETTEARVPTRPRAPRKRAA